ncbi:MAG: hypothetical protein L3J74_16160 [Bacteroidales bacterium]|nr:hypothetical protein [Bacteroidales bacterium]
MRLFDYYKYFSFLSLDIVLGALSGGIMAQKIFNIPINYTGLIILGISVWIIYTADHLLDNMKSKNKTPAERRLFYRKYFKLLSIFEIFFVAIVIYMSFRFFEIKLIKAGFIIVLFIAVYFLMLYLFNAKRVFLLQKELIVALIYTIGIFIAPFVKTYPEINICQILIMLVFFLIVWADILLISIFEYDKDLKDNFTSLPIIIGVKNTANIMKILLYLAFVVLIVINLLFPFNIIYTASSTILLVIAIAQIIIYKHKTYFNQKDIYRFVTEAVFFLPALIIFI